MLLQSFEWSPWQSLRACWADRALEFSGLYRVRRAAHDDIDYIGETSLRLRQRLAMLGGAYGTEMPYRAPHTVAPALWAQRQISAEEYEASGCPVVGDERWRKALERVALAQYRQAHRCSPSFNFGRMPAGYRMSSSNSANLVAAGRRFRGGRTDASDSSHLPSLCPVGSLDGDPCGDGWCGHEWSPWVPLTSMMAGLARAAGVYRIRGSDGRIVYIGQGMIRSRLAKHRRSAIAAGSPQGQALAAAQPLACSWVVSAAWKRHQLLELENDLIAAWVLATGSPPAAQFYGHGAGL